MTIGAVSPSTAGWRRPCWPPKELAKPLGATSEWWSVSGAALVLEPPVAGSRRARCLSGEAERPL